MSVNLEEEMKALLDGMEPVATASARRLAEVRLLRGTTSITEVAQISMAVSMRRIADALRDLGTPTMVVSSKTSFREMSPEEIITAMSRAGRTHPEEGADQ